MEQRLAQGHHGVLADVVDGHERRRHQPGGGCRIHDVALAVLPQHEGDEAADAVHDAHQIHAEEPPPVLEARLPDVPAAAGHAGIVEEQMYGPEVRGHTFSELLHVFCPRHVDANPHRLRPAFADLRNRRVEGVILHVSQHQLHPLVRGDAREFASESAARAGDDGDLAGEILHRRLLARSITTAAALGQAIGLPVSLCGTAFGDRLRT